MLGRGARHGYGDHYPAEYHWQGPWLQKTMITPTTHDNALVLPVQPTCNLASGWVAFVKARTCPVHVVCSPRGLVVVAKSQINSFLYVVWLVCPKQQSGSTDLVAVEDSDLQQGNAVVMLLSPAGALKVMLVLCGALGLQQIRHQSPVFERGTSTAIIPYKDVLLKTCAAARLHGDSCWEKTQTPQPQGWRVAPGGFSFVVHSSSSSATEDELSDGSSPRRQARNSEKNRAGRNNSRSSSLESPQQSPLLEVLHQNEHFA